MSCSGGLAALVLLLALVLAPAPVRAQDNLQLAHEQMERRAFGDAGRFIKAEIQQNARFWRGHYMLGQYYLRGLNQADTAISEWLKTWGFAIGRTRIGPETEEFRQLGESLTQAVLDRVAASGDSGPKILEQALVEHSFVLLPLIRMMCDRFVTLQKWAAIRKVFALANKHRTEDYYRRNESELAWLDYYEGRAMAAQNDAVNAFARLTDGHAPAQAGLRSTFTSLSIQECLGHIQRRVNTDLATYRRKHPEATEGFLKSTSTRIWEALTTSTTASAFSQRLRRVRETLNGDPLMTGRINKVMAKRDRLTEHLRRRDVPTASADIDQMFKWLDGWTESTSRCRA